MVQVRKLSVLGKWRHSPEGAFFRLLSRIFTSQAAGKVYSHHLMARFLVSEVERRESWLSSLLFEPSCMGLGHFCGTAKKEERENPKAHVFLFENQARVIFCGSRTESQSLCLPFSRHHQRRWRRVWSLKNPTLFIFAENDAVIPLEQVSWHLFKRMTWHFGKISQRIVLLQIVFNIEILKVGFLLGGDCRERESWHGGSW